MKLMMTLFAMTVTVTGHAQELDGKTLFAKNCSACHQVTGKGIEGAFPALKGNHFVQSDSAPVIATVLNGRGGMPTFATSLNDEKLAEILSYVRQAWGNQAGAVSSEEVKAVRAQSGAANSMDSDTHLVPSH
jgi:mono/diheme cytochrome c family protein